MQRQSVKSSNIQSVGYDQTKKLLEVEFSSGSIYQYKDVPADVHKKMISASSVGSFFHGNIRNKFNFERVT